MEETKESRSGAQLTSDLGNGDDGREEPGEKRDEFSRETRFSIGRETEKSGTNLIVS